MPDDSSEDQKSTRKPDMLDRVFDEAQPPQPAAVAPKETKTSTPAAAPGETPTPAAALPSSEGQDDSLERAWGPQLSLTPQTAASSPNRPKTLPSTGGGGGAGGVSDWASWLPAAGATVLPFAVGAAAGPPGWLADIGLASAGALGGSIWKQALENDPQKDTGTMLREAGTDALLQGALPEGIGVATGAALGKIFNPERLYQSALGPGGKAAEAEKAVRGGLEGKIVLNEGAQEANRLRGKALNDQIEKMIDSSSAKLSPKQYLSSLGDSLDKLRAEWSKDPIQGSNFLDQIDNYERQFLIDHGNVQPITRQGFNPAKGFTPQTQATTITINPEDMTLAELRANANPIDAPTAQDIKQQAYRTINAGKASAWDPLGQSGVSIETRQSISRALRQDLEGLFPTLKDMNRQSGDSQALDKALDKFASRNLSNPWKTSLGALLGINAAELALGHPKLVAPTIGLALVKKAMADPVLRSRLAIALHGAAQTPLLPQLARAAGRAAVRAPIAAGKIMIDPVKAKQGPQPPEGQASGGLSKSDGYLEGLERRAYGREAALNSLRGS
jgi:hypothetical protein